MTRVGMQKHPQTDFAVGGTLGNENLLGYIEKKTGFWKANPKVKTDFLVLWRQIGEPFIKSWCL